jgi:hypothetical protein
LPSLVVSSRFQHGGKQIAKEHERVFKDEEK